MHPKARTATDTEAAQTLGQRQTKVALSRSGCAGRRGRLWLRVIVVLMVVVV